MYRRYVSPKPAARSGDTYLRYMSPRYSAFGLSNSSATRLSTHAALR
jgi:hypothetical protein